ncbi:hypothetical protein W97_00838 [Coniosporium apollinis CBS 100218]|uniref:Spermatogenesis-associated protein 20-like TRX domain-containing protein n=1 Tax=Coniosporium apollinis (strain CBS 100218) TaxID=1168221 RepID=R7YIC2_CONA1|nr:uncharacterized protein W97_00838 [Coniosporium apollinis CBS 100218]EON61623.1 hypothetical protein W97_00838 [Coniosporium apollinis CBS 100218]
MASATELNLSNRLNESRSPYVRGHMNNPVAWQMWTPEALALAKKHNRLLFVSIGYAACHWCHVMERESFENQEIARILNESFIPIKIDREERPDVDRIYMNYVQATTGSGGWPLNVFLTPDLKPIFGGTYWPGPSSATGHRGHIGFLGILQKIRDLWRDKPEVCLESGNAITEQLREFANEGTISKDNADHEGDGLDLELLEESYQHFERKYDRMYAGFGGAPKFPTPVNLSFLIRLSQYPSAVQDVVGAQECDNAQKMVLATLNAMTRGGIHDQIGNGFARYSVTRDWSLPHFEKMLYDQGQLLQVYLDAYLITKDPVMLETVHDIATYLTTPPMHSPTGGFFSAEDADSYYRPQDTEKREGAFYVWTLKEFQSILGEQDAEICARYWDVRDSGNVSPEHDAHDELTNQNVLCIRRTPEQLAKVYGMSREDILQIIAKSRQKLLEHRNRERPRPALDDKIVVGWNGLAVGALARTSAALAASDPEKSHTYLAAAEKAVHFIKSELFDESTSTMKRVYREGPGDAPAFADDYAFLISGLIDLYEATFDDQYLRFADTLQQAQIAQFWDDVGGGFFSTAPDQPDLILRLKDGMDNAEPGTNGVSANNLWRLGSLLEDETYTERARRTCGAFEAEVGQHPFLFSSMMTSIVADVLGMKSVVVCGEGEEVEEAVRRIRESAGTTRTVARLGGGSKSEWLRERNELFRSLDPGKPRVQVCEGGVCKEELKVGDVEKALSRFS